ncbi:MAG: hydroxymethylglutaryl-CoA lyase [Gemmobacter sp.]
MAAEAGVILCDVTPRDGLQTLPEHWTVAARVALIDRLSAAGLPRIEAVSFANPARVPQMAEPEAVLAGIARPPGCAFAGLAMNARGVERALAAPLDEVRFVIVATETLSQRNQSAGVAETVAAFRAAAPSVRAAGRRLTAVVAVAFGCPFEGEVPPARVAALAAEAVAAGADEVILADTIGVGVPAQARDLGARLGPVLGGRVWGVHLHNTRNTGLATALAAIEAGARVVDAATGGIGGCPFATGATGNIATEDLVWMLHRSGIGTGVDMAALMALSAALRAQVPGAHTGQVVRAGDWPQDRARAASARASPPCPTPAPPAPRPTPPG